MFVLIGFRKSDEEKIIATNVDRDVLQKICTELNAIAYAGYDMATGLWDNDRIKGRFWIEEVDNIDPIQAGLDFINYKDK